MSKTIEELIGKHPDLPEFFAEWLNYEDMPIPTINPNKKHRKLSEKDNTRDKAIEQIAQFIIDHHLDIKKQNRLRVRKDEILLKYGLSNFQDYLDTQTLFPKSRDTQKGNATEIILSNYLQKTTRLSLLAYKLTYNPNVEQSIKGDDCLLFNKDDIFDKILVGEAKFRNTPQPKGIRDIIENLEGNKKLPISLPFIAQYFTTSGQEDLASKTEDLLYEISQDKIHIINVGFLLSTRSSKRGKDTFLQVENNLNTSNPNLVFLSFGTDEPHQIIEKAFDLAYKQLISQL